MNPWHEQSQCAKWSRTALAVAILLISAPQIAGARPSEGGRTAGTLSINDVTANEGNSGTSSFTFTVTHSGTSDPFYVDAFTADGTAAAGSDYAQDGGTSPGFNGTDGETLSFTVDVTGDTTFEPDETFFVNLSNVVAYGSGSLGLPTIAGGQGVGTILNDDPDPGDGGGGGGGGGSSATLSINDVSMSEGNSGFTNFDFTVSLSGASDPFLVDGITGPDTAGSSPASPGSDATSTSETLSFAGTAGETRTFRVPVVGDTVQEPDETFLVTLSNIRRDGVAGPLGLPTFSENRARATIINDDGGGGGGGVISFSPARRSFGQCGGAGFVTLLGVSSDTIVSAPYPWLTITGANAAAATISYAVTPNAGPNAVTRTGSMAGGGQTFEVTQAGGTAYCSRATDLQGGIGHSGPSVVKNQNQLWGDWFIVQDGRAIGDNLVAIEAYSDIDGDGLDEFGATGKTFQGAGRRADSGAWVQFYDSAGKRVLDFFPGAEFSGLQVLTLDTDGDGRAEPVFLGTEDSGASELQLRSSDGKLDDQQTVSPAGSYATQLLPFEWDGTPGQEVGIAYEANDGTGHFAVWGRSAGAKKLELLSERPVIEAKSAFHQWLPLDVDGDGLLEIAATFTETSGKGASLRVLDPHSGAMLVDRRVLRGSFEQPVWTFGDFDATRPGAEFLVGYRRKGKDSVLFKVLRGDGKDMSKGSISGQATAQAWGAIRSAAGPGGAVGDLVFVAFVRPDGETTFEVWDPSTKKAKRTGAATVADSESEVVAWQLDDFDGDANNGWEIVAVTRHLDDGRIEFQAFDREGTALTSRVQAFDGTYVSLTSSALAFERKNRVDLTLMARTVDGQPLVRIWNVIAANLLVELDVLSKDVR